jgi:hypothetical protein
MEELLIRLGELSVGFLSMMGPLVLLIIFLKLRDERESNLYTVVLKELNSPDLRGLFALKIRCSVFSKQDTIMVDLWSCSKEQVWDIVIRLSTHLPPEVRLVVNSMTDFRSRPTLTPRVEKRLPSVRSVSFCRYK